MLTFLVSNKLNLFVVGIFCGEVKVDGVGKENWRLVEPKETKERINKDFFH
jgi:hypothetical protein